MKPAELIAGATLVASAVAARRPTVSASEERVFRALNDGPDQLHLPLWAIMQVGSLAGALTAAGLEARRDPQRGARMLAVGVGVWGGVKVSKRLIGGRGRPARHLDGVKVRGHPQSGLGYPSGHAAVSLAIAVVAAEGRDRSVGQLLGATAVVTGLARAYVGAHLPLDVVGGWAIGTLAGRLCRRC